MARLGITSISGEWGRGRKDHLVAQRAQLGPMKENQRALKQEPRRGHWKGR